LTLKVALSVLQRSVKKIYKTIWANLSDALIVNKLQSGQWSYSTFNHMYCFWNNYAILFEGFFSCW